MALPLEEKLRPRHCLRSKVSILPVPMIRRQHYLPRSPFSHAQGRLLQARHMSRRVQACPGVSRRQARAQQATHQTAVNLDCLTDAMLAINQNLAGACLGWSRQPLMVHA